MTWSQLDWNALDRLRAGFLSGSAAAGPYWQSSSDLASYDFTYGARIGWERGGRPPRLPPPHRRPPQPVLKV